MLPGMLEVDNAEGLIGQTEFCARESCGTLPLFGNIHTHEKLCDILYELRVKRRSRCVGGEFRSTPTITLVRQNPTPETMNRLTNKQQGGFSLSTLETHAAKPPGRLQAHAEEYRP